MPDFIQDVKSSVRSLRQNSLYAAAVIVTLALGIAPNCVVFTIMDGIYFRPLPYPQQDRLVPLNVSHPSKATIDDVDAFTLLEWQRRATSFEVLAAYQNTGIDLTFEDRPERIPGLLTTADFFRVVGMRPALGRAFRPEDCVRGAPPVLVISHRTWQDTFAGRADIVNDGFAFDQRVVVFTLLLTAVTMVLFGVVPALRGSRVDLAPTLKEWTSGSGRGTGRRRMSKALVVAQVALCVMTLIVAALMTRSFLHFSRLSSNPGFDPRSLIVAALPHSGEPSARSEARLAALQDIEGRIAAEPGVGGVALANRLPFLESGSPVVLSKRAPGPEEQAGERIEADARTVNPGYFSMMSIPLLKGRTFTTEDRENNLPVVVIDDRLANARWNDADPLGEWVLVDGTWRTIVGVVGSNIAASPFRSSSREIYLPYLQAPPGDMKVIVQSSRALDSVSAAVRRQVRAVDRDQPLADLQSMEQALDGFMAPFRLILALISLFGGIALALAAVGLYGVVAHGVSCRTREIGVRMALGAGRRDVVNMIVREGLRPAIVGLVLGLLLGIALARILPSEILGVRGLSLYHYAGAAALWFAVALVACLIPARRAARVNGLTALRCE